MRKDDDGRSKIMVKPATLMNDDDDRDRVVDDGLGDVTGQKGGQKEQSGRDQPSPRRLHVMGMESAEHVRFDGAALAQRAASTAYANMEDPERGIILNRCLFLTTVMLIVLSLCIIFIHPPHLGVSVAMIVSCAWVMMTAFNAHRLSALWRKRSHSTVLFVYASIMLGTAVPLSVTALLFLTAALSAAFFQRNRSAMLHVLLGAFILVAGTFWRRGEHNAGDMTLVIVMYSGCGILLTWIVDQLHQSFDDTIRSLNKRTTDLQLSQIALEQESAERLQVEQQVSEAMRLKSLATLSSGIAHEINQPLSAIRVKAGLLEMAIERDGVIDGALLTQTCISIGAGVERISDIINHMRELTHNETEVSVTAIDVSVVCERVRDLMRERLHEHGVMLKNAILTDVPLLYGHILQCEQVFINLIDNAIKSFAAEVPIKNIVVSAELAENMYVLRVTDNGPGFGMRASRALEPFFTERMDHSGQGLGLALVHSFVRAWGGRVELTDVPTGGACVSVYMRIADDQTAVDQTAVEEETL